MRSDAYTPIGYGLPQISSTQPLEKILLKPAVRTSEFYGLQGAALLPWVADLFSSAPVPMWLKLTISAACQVMLAIARAWPKSKVGEVLAKLPPLPAPSTLPTSSPPITR